MKRIVIFAAVMAFVMGLKAQNCTALVLPYFNGDAAEMATYPQEKLDFYCAFARAAFYESDTVPAGAEIYPISEVVAKADGVHLTADFSVDLSTLSFYAYNFNDIQLRYHRGNVTICFSTPVSAHPYLVLRSIEDMYAVAEEIIKNER